MPDTNPTAQKIKDCYELFIKYKGSSHTQIELEMRSLGYAKFSRPIFYSRTEAGVGVAGGAVQEVNQMKSRESENSSRAPAAAPATFHTPWIEDFLDEASRFTGRSTHHDDQIDAVSLAVQMLAKNNKLYRF